MRARRIVAAVVSLSVVACTLSDGRQRARDTLVARELPRAAPAITATSTSPAADAGASRDSLDELVNASVVSAGTLVGQTLPELALVAADGRRVGYDPVTRRTVSRLPGGSYASERPPADDAAAPGDTTAPPEQDIESRVVTARVPPGQRVTLEVIAHGAGTFDLSAYTITHRRNGDATWKHDSVTLTATEVRRYVLLVTADAIKVTEPR